MLDVEAAEEPGHAEGHAPPPQNNQRKRRQTGKHRISLPLLNAGAHAAARSHGTRRLHLRLRVPQWPGVNGEPPAANIPVSQAAVLFDIAYAASLSHHASILSLTRATWDTGNAVSIFLATAVPTVCQWWAISLFLCRFDPGDLISEFILVLYMILVVGQSLTVQDCATCLLSENLVQRCRLNPGSSIEHYYDRLTCSPMSAPDGAAWAFWPALPFQCWLYGLLSLAPRVLQILNALRAVHDIVYVGKRDAALHALEKFVVMVLWLSAVSQTYVPGAAACIVSAVIMELLCITVEPARRVYRLLLHHGLVAVELEEIPMDIGYAEKRWQRLLMISLAMLPHFSSVTDLYGLTRARRIALPPSPDVRLVPLTSQSSPPCVQTR